MKIAIIGWGSLIWDTRGLPIAGSWQDNGPELPIEFSRISRDGRLTLVIDPKNGTPTKTLFATSSRTSLEIAIEDLCGREGTVASKIGAISIEEAPSINNQIGMAVRAWCISSGYDAAIWTALESNFAKKTGHTFSNDTVISYVKSVSKAVRAEIMKYVINAPLAVNTPIRRIIMEEFANPGLHGNRRE